MKVRLNKATLDQMPEQVRALVQEWRDRWHKSSISVTNTTGFYPAEDARVTLLNLRTGAEASEQAAGEFAGMTRLSPGAQIPLPVGIVAVETGFFCGNPFLTIWQGSLEQLAENQQCQACGGDGVETCDNPDHGFIEALGGEISRLGCPGCGHDPDHKMKGPCPECGGTGIAAKQLTEGRR